MPKDNTIRVSSCKTTFCCKYCGYEAKGEKGIKLHLKYTHNIKNSTQQSEVKTIVECGLCGKILKNDNTSAKKHYRSHQVLM